MKTSVQTLNIETARVSAEGVEGFCWPVGTKECEPVIEHMARGCADVACEALAKGRTGGEALQVAMHHILVTAFGVFNAQLVMERVRSRGCDADFPAHYATLNEFANGRSPRMPGIIHILQKGPSPLSLPRLPLRLARDLIIQRSVKRRRLAGPDFRREIIASAISPLIEADAAAQSEPVTFRRPNLWFSAANGRDVAGRNEKADPGLVDDLIEALAASFENGGIRMDGTSAGFFREFLPLMMALVCHHLKGVLDDRTRIPDRLWTGTGGDIWSRILRQAVRLSGGEVTGHDHALGEGHLDVIDKTIVELELCDRFVTRNPHQAGGVKASVRKDMLIQKHVPEITHIDAAASHRQRELPRQLRQAGNPLKVMFVGTIYPADTIRYSTVMPDMVALDWHARLLAWVRVSGHTPIFKPHPESFTQAPTTLDPLCERLEQPFGKVMDQADLFVFDCHTSTTLRDAMLSDRPIIYVDFGVAPYFPESRAQFSRRCAVVEGWFDEHNRAQVDWAMMGEALTRSQVLNDHDFARNYLL